MEGAFAVLDLGQIPVSQLYEHVKAGHTIRSDLEDEYRALEPEEAEELARLENKLHTELLRGCKHRREQYERILLSS